MLKLFKNARIHTPWDYGAPRCGRDQGQVISYENGALLCRDALIDKIGPLSEVTAGLDQSKLDLQVDCGGRCLIPGFVDPHTHMCFVHRREEEFLMRLNGVPYLEILQRGGGILSSVRSVRDASMDQLTENTSRMLHSALCFGTTTVEIKSGYGLDTINELKMMEAISRAASTSCQDVTITFLGAHAVPYEFKRDPDGYVDLVIKEMIPAAREQGLAKFCDVFCEEGVFSLEQSRRVLQKAKDAGFGLKIHADEIHSLGGAGLAAELGAVSADHLLAATDQDLEAMARAGSVGVLLPATSYSLKKPYARARDLIKLKVPVALATDCNPGSSFTESMPFVIGLAVMKMNLSVNEALTAVTQNAAYAIGRAANVGSLQPGKSADFLLLDGQTPAILAYHAGVSPVTAVFKRGELVFSSSNSIEVTV